MSGLQMLYLVAWYAGIVLLPVWAADQMNTGTGQLLVFVGVFFTVFHFGGKLGEAVWPTDGDA